ncbi:large ribosomal subunit protein P1 [Corylus avellana]|uniref:large ribosomal subunit protein P1 n=1 Tax=Corylus avellana TaxID=13451 RepID=UPI001E206400|nr:large ribosomal subunit protein P1 [Corylus avellana]
MSSSELACTYASLILHDDGIAITADKIATLVKSAGVTVESYWPSLFAKLSEKRSIEDLVLNAASGGGGGCAAPVAVAAAAGGAAAAAAAAPKVEEKEEAKEESDDDMGFSLFD